MTYKELDMMRSLVDLTAEDVSITIAPSSKWKLKDYCPDLCEDFDRDLPDHISVYYREGDSCVDFFKAMLNVSDTYDLKTPVKGLRVFIVLLDCTE